MKRIVALISGRGSNLEALVQDLKRQPALAEVVAVICNRSDAPGLQRARALGLACEVLPHGPFASRDAFDAALGDSIDRHAPDLVVLAGFMRILGAQLVQRFAGRMLNIHPSLLPAFPGLDTHGRAIEAGCTVAGATVHLVTPALDHGPILAQAVVPVLEGDSAQGLSERVLQAEHRLYPAVIRAWLQGDYTVTDSGVRSRRGAPRHWFVDAG